MGDLQIEVNGNPVPGPAYSKGWALLAYLAIEPRWHARERLGELLWPDAQGNRATLRQVVSNLRNALNDRDASAPILQVNRNAIRLNPESPVLIDVVEFASWQSACTDKSSVEHCAPCIADMDRPGLLSHGELLPHLAFPDCPDFENWLQISREKLHRNAVALFERLLDCSDASGDRTRSLAIARHLEELDPFNELAQRHHMHRYAAAGQVSLALKQFESFSSWLYQEVGTSPEMETLALYEQIHSGAYKPSNENRHSVQVTSPTLPERRRVTVLYCELNVIGHDPEEIAEQQQQPVRQSLAIIRRHGGFVVQTHGGNIFAYFGYPSAMENAALLAVRTALEISRSTTFPAGSTISLHTGQIVTGGDRSMPDTAGITTDIAIRLGQTFNSSGLILSDATHSLVSAYVQTRPLGKLALQPNLDPIEAYLLLEERTVSTRLESAEQLTPMVGRKNELACLKRYWRKTTQNGTNCTILVSGEPGIGKSRLVKCIEETLCAETATVVKWHCREEYCGTALHTVTEHLSRVCTFAPNDGKPEKIRKLQCYIDRHFPGIGDQSLSLLARLLSLNADGCFYLPGMAPPQEKLLVFELLLGMLRMLASQKPLLFILEDVHWADHSTLELLDKLMTEGIDKPLLVLLTARPEFRPARQVMRIDLMPLSETETANLVSHMRPGHGFSSETMQRIVRATDGVPLFIEEMTRRLVDDGNEIIGDTIIPATLHDLLAARLDRLGDAKILAQAAATIGRQFSLDLLHAALPDTDINDIRRMLLILEESVLICKLECPEIDYQFRHALIADTAYQSQTRLVRRTIHGHIAEALARNRNTAHELPAKHYFEAGELGKAIEWWILAGMESAAKCANTEAIGHFNRALDAVEMLPAAPDRDEIELRVLVELGGTLISSFGYGSPEASRVYMRAFALSEKTGLSLTLFRSIWGLYLGCSSRTNHRDAMVFAERLLELARVDGSEPLLIAAHYAHTNTAYSLGRFADSIRHMEAARMLYQPELDDSIIALFGEHVLVSAMQFGSWALWTVNRSADSLDTATEALAIARRIDHAPTLCFAYCFCGILYRLHANIDKVREYGEALSALAAKHEFGLWQLIGSLIEGWVQAAQGKPDGVSRIAAAVDVMRQGVMMQGIIMYFLEILAEAHGMLGQYDEQMAVLNEAMTIMGRVQDTHFEAEIYRLAGENLMNSSSNPAKAEAWLQQALEVARRQGASMLELRAEASLFRLAMNRA